MSSMRLVHKPDGWWLEIHNQEGSEALINLGDQHGPIVRRALEQYEAFQKGNSDDIQELRGRNRALIEALESVAETMKSAIENYGE